MSEKKGYVIDKQKTVKKLLGEQDFQVAWDVGSNDGFYSKLLVKNTLKVFQWTSTGSALKKLFDQQEKHKQYFSHDIRPV